MTEVYDEAGRRKVAALWDAIAGRPDRINEIAALVDPNALRYVGWDDTLNQLDFFEFDSADIPYDNTTSGLTATDVQAAIDELAGTLAPNVFHGWVSATGTTGTSALPAGWTVTRPAAGRYIITHGLTLSVSTDLRVVAMNEHTSEYMSCEYDALGLNSFEVIIGRGAGVQVSRAFFFIAYSV